MRRPTQAADGNLNDPDPTAGLGTPARVGSVERPEMNSVSMPAWQKSSFCGNSTCVEVAKIDADTYLVRDSKRPENPALSFTGEEWTAFIAGVQAGEFTF